MYITEPHHSVIGRERQSDEGKERGDGDQKGNGENPQGDARGEKESGGDQAEVRSERRCRRREGEWRRPGRGEIRKEMQEERRRVEETRQR